MLRASAKNFLRVLSVCNPEDYDSIIKELKKNDGKISLETRFKMAGKTFNHTAEYDRNISGFLRSSALEEMMNCYNGGEE